MCVSKTSNNELAVGANNGATDQPSNQPQPANPWKTFAGIWRDNPDFDAFCNEIKQLRGEADRVDAGS